MTEALALKRAKRENEAHGEIETEHPGYLSAQDTYCAGRLKGVRRVYQQTFKELYDKKCDLAYKHIYSSYFGPGRGISNA
jgi:hypothetical protein